MVPRLLLPLALVVAACTSSTSQGDPPKVAAADAVAVAADPTATPAASAEAAADPSPSAATDAAPDAADSSPNAADSSPSAAADAPPTVRSETRWYCLCYRRTIAGGEEPVTACRSTQDACTKLQSRARSGGNGLVARSVMRACQELRADHPGDLLGDRSRWAPSKVPGAWLSTGECLLLAGSPREGEPASETDEEAVVLAAEAAAERFYASESLGTIAPGTKDSALIELLGPPTRKDAREMAEYSGSYEQTWEWVGRGVKTTMVSAGKRGPQRVGLVVIEAPSELRTARGVGVGETKERVAKLYADAKAVDSDESVADEVFVAGSVYGGLFFMLEDGKVSMIILGPGAE